MKIIFFEFTDRNLLKNLFLNDYHIKIDLFFFFFFFLNFKSNLFKRKVNILSFYKKCFWKSDIS